MCIRDRGKEYRIYAPKRFPGRGARAGSDLVRYAPLRSAAEIVTDAPSDFSAKEIFYPVNPTMLYFQDDACRALSLIHICSAIIPGRAISGN